MPRISTSQLTSMCHRFGISLRAGTDMLKMLNSAAGHGSPAYREHMADIARRVGGGATFAEAMRAQGNYFPELVLELADVGEQTGRLETVFLRLADHYQHMIRLRRVFLGAIAWPLFELIIGIIIVGGLIFFLGVIGAKTGVFGLSGGRGLVIYLVNVGIFFTAVGLIVFGLLRGWFGHAPTSMVMHLPGVGKSLQTMALARMAWTLSLALNAGIDAHRAIRLALRSTQLPYYTRHLDTVDGVIARGGQFHEALQQTGAFPREFLDALEASEIAGTETESLEHLSREYQERAEMSTKALAVVAGVFVWMMIAALMIFVIINLFMTLYLGPINEATNWATNPR